MPRTNKSEKRRYDREYAYRRKEKHLCEKCGRQDAHTLDGHWLCAECSAKEADRRRRKRRESETVRENERRRNRASCVLHPTQ